MKKSIALLLFLAVMYLSPPAFSQSAVHGNLNSQGAACIANGATPNCLVFYPSQNTGGVSITLGGTFSATVQVEAAGDPARSNS